MDGDPAVLANGNAVAAIILPEPRNDRTGLGAMLSITTNVVVGKRDVERTQSRDKIGRKVAIALLRMVIATEIRLPVAIPGAGGVGSRVVLGRQLAHPENGGGHIAMPGLRTKKTAPRIFQHDLRHLGHSKGIAQRGKGPTAIIQKALVLQLQALGQAGSLREGRKSETGQEAGREFHWIEADADHSVITAVNLNNPDSFTRNFREKN